MKCHIQIFIDNSWQTAAIFEPSEKTLGDGVLGSGMLEYDFDFAYGNLDTRNAEIAPGFPVGFELFRFEQWPAFLTDLLPGGAGRRAWLQRMQVEKDGPHLDWHFLLKGAGAPPGNLRIAEAVPSPPPNHFKLGFPRIDIIEQREHFLEYAEERGAYVSGASSVQGEAPKFLLAEDHNGMFHAEGSLPDEKCADFWLVKFPRGQRSDDRNQQILRNEAPYLEVARAFGVRVARPLTYANGALFVPRFDRRIANGKVIRFGMHSLYAVSGIPGFGTPTPHDVFCRALTKIATDPAQEIREYLKRDILNLALRNTDNHGRNSAILNVGGEFFLSPLFDFAPMFLDPEGIGRVCRWEGEKAGVQPAWGKICEKLEPFAAPYETRTWLANLSDAVVRLPETMQHFGVEDDIIERLAPWIREVAKGLTGND